MSDKGKFTSLTSERVKEILYGLNERCQPAVIEKEQGEESLSSTGCPHCGSYEGDATECPECGHGQ